MDLDSNPKCLLLHMRIEDNNHNKRATVDSNRMMWMRTLKNDNCIIRMRILLITAYAYTFSPLPNWIPELYIYIYIYILFLKTHTKNDIFTTPPQQLDNTPSHGGGAQCHTHPHTPTPM
jgi:hypothetical protein